MKYKLPIILCSVPLYLLSLSLMAQPTATIEITEPGSGETLFAQHKDAIELIVSGHLNHLDLMALRANCTLLETLDLSAVSIEAYSDEISYEDYPANELSVALAYYKSLKSLLLPVSLQRIASKALYGCISLQAISLPGASVPEVGGNYFVESKRMPKMTLYVPADLLQTYQNSPSKAWRFGTITTIALPNPYAGVTFDNIYGPNYYPFSDINKRAVIYSSYFTNGSQEIVDDIEMEYWYDDEETRHTVRLNKVQLLPGKEMPDGLGTIILEAPDDTYTHLLHLRPSKINNVPVDHMQTTHKPVRVYELIDDFRFNEHLIELYYDPSDSKGQAKYANLINALSTIIAQTRKNNRFSREHFCLVTITGQMKNGSFVPSVADVKNQALTYRVDSLPLFTYDRDLMTPYGTLNNERQLSDMSIYTPTLRVGDVEDIHQYLFSRSYNYPAFCRMDTPLVEQESGTYRFQITTSGRINPNVNLSNPLRLTYYLVENDTLPEAYSDQIGYISKGITYSKLVQLLSPLEGYPIEVSPTRTFTHRAPLVEIPRYVSGKYRLVAIVHCSEDPHIYARSVLESFSIPLDQDHVIPLGVDAIAPSEPRLVRDSTGKICTTTPEWTVSALYSLAGVSLSPDTAVSSGCYIVTLRHSRGSTLHIKYILNKID